MPHHGVVNVNKLGIVRVVFHASGKCDNVSLNDKLLPGIDYLNSLIGVLTKFRHGKYAIMGNIEKMFLQVKVIEVSMHCVSFGKKDYPCIVNWSLKTIRQE